MYQDAKSNQPFNAQAICGAPPVPQSIKDRAHKAMQGAAELRIRMDDLCNRAGVSANEATRHDPRPAPDNLMQIINELNDVINTAHDIMTRLDTIA